MAGASMFFTLLSPWYKIAHVPGVPLGNMQCSNFSDVVLFTRKSSKMSPELKSKITGHVTLFQLGPPVFVARNALALGSILYHVLVSTLAAACTLWGSAVTTL